MDRIILRQIICERVYMFAHVCNIITAVWNGHIL